MIGDIGLIEEIEAIAKAENIEEFLREAVRTARPFKELAEA